MDAQRKPGAVAAAPGERTCRKQQRKFTRKRPAFAKAFCPDENNFAVLCVGWPPVRPPAANVLALPPDESPAAFDWRPLRGCHVAVMPPPAARAPREVLRELGAELVAVGVESLTIFDGSEIIADWWHAGRPQVRA